MSESKTEPRSVSSQNDETPKKPGCLKSFLVACLFGLTALLVTVFVIDKMNVGRKIAKNLKEIAAGFGGAPAPVVAPKPVEPEVKIVEKIVKVEVPVEKIVEKIVEVEVIPPMPSSYIPWQKLDTAKLWNGIQIANSVEASQGAAASLEREKDEAIQVEMKLKFKIPTPSDSIDELAGLNEHLPKIMPGLATLVEQAEVSPFYHHLYERKTERLQQHATRFDKLLSVHNFYDTETVLELENPETQQHALLIQSEMDVVSDGSDGDRWPFLDNYISMSQYYQPFTSYGWAKRTGRPNPLLERWESELKKHTERFAVKGLSIEENRFLRSKLDTLPREIEDMKARSYLIAEADPFIVMSLAFLGRREETKFGPMIGDYAVVIHEDKIYPTIVGDAGPSFKFGEASLRLARQINEKASPYSRPVSDLSITYLVFPGSREDVNTPPDYEKWRSKCQEYLDKLGGLGEGYSLHQWEDIIPVKLEEWKAKHPGETIATPPPAEPVIVDPATLPQPSFSTPVTPTAAPEESTEDTAEESVEEEP
ncbi:MAG: glycoside hydrolase family 75 protein [Verrucomicrobiales bacterium]|nr:glycoside hydrolase family 75 protein [Verrucomicrobiales bacterium]